MHRTSRLQLRRIRFQRKHSHRWVECAVCERHAAILGDTGVLVAGCGAAHVNDRCHFASVRCSNVPPPELYIIDAAA